MFRTGALTDGQIWSTIFTGKEKHKLKAVNVEVYRLVSVIVREPQLFKIVGFQWQTSAVSTTIIIILPSLILGSILGWQKPSNSLFIHCTCTAPSIPAELKSHFSLL